MLALISQRVTRRWVGVFISLFLLSFANFSYAQENPVLKVIKPVFFGLPIDCQVEEDCWVMNYVDFKPDDGAQTDPACLARTYDGHKGTDFAVLDGAAMERGVNVLAAADGTIARLRDGEKDSWHSPSDLKEIKASQKECGNGIFIDHGEGLSTIYCHLKRGSIVVKRGQAVKKGDKIAQVGLSGMTEFPHLHFGITKENKVLDPFTGKDTMVACGGDGKPLWDQAMKIAYQPMVIQAVGFSNKAPDLNEIERQVENFSEISFNAGVISFWVTLLGVREGDEIIIEIKDPNGNIFAERQIKQDKTRARQFYFVGKRLNDPIIIEGGYTGSVKVTRGNDSWYKASAVLLVK